jgi:hypothetical protein
MKTREDAARRFAKLKGLAFVSDVHGERFVRCPVPGKQCDIQHEHLFWLPKETAPLHARMEFVGWIAEAVGPEFVLDEIRLCGGSGDGPRYSVDFMSTVTPGPGSKGGGFSAADDLSWSALAAAIAALESSR